MNDEEEQKQKIFLERLQQDKNIIAFYFNFMYWNCGICEIFQT